MSFLRFLLPLSAIILIIYFIIRQRNRSPYVRCTKCGGAGGWQGVRGKEKCDLCYGSGKIHKSIK